MDPVAAALQAFWPILILAGIVAAIVAAIAAWRRRQELPSEEEEGVGTVRRLYYYFATFVYMIVASVGVVLIARYVLDDLFGPPRLHRDVTQLALGVVLALIWTPMWVWHRLRVQRLLEDEPAERSSVLRKVAVYLSLGVTAALAAQAAVEVLRWLLGATSFGGYPVAAVVVWGGLWALTWLTEAAEGQPTDETKTVRRLYVYGASTLGLAMLAAAGALVIYVIFREAYEGIVDLPVLLRTDEGLWSEPTKGALAFAVVGAVLWSTHWFRFARDDTASDVRQFYLYTLAILGGVVTTLSATGVILYGLLQWGMGTPAEDTASAHFRFLPGALAPLLVGLLLWAYHWAVVQQERAAMGEGELHVAQREYRYILTALGLGALAGSVITLVPTFIAIVVTSAQEVLVGPDWWRDRMVLVFTLALLGAPVWAYHWYRAQRAAGQFGAEERNSLPRRILIWGVIGVGALAMLGSASHVLFLLLNGTLENRLSLTLLRDAKWSMGAFVAAAIFAPYYWFVLQDDRRVAPAAPERTGARKAVTMLIAADGAGLVDQIEAALGAKVHVLHRADAGADLPVLSSDDIARLNQRIEQAPGKRVLLVAGAGGVDVFSYQ